MAQTILIASRRLVKTLILENIGELATVDLLDPSIAPPTARISSMR
jgi:hypothetical protein